MKILLIGYGKMGKAIEKIAVERGHEIAGRIDIHDAPPFPPADVAIEFSTPESVAGNVRQCIDQGIPVVVGTTGWAGSRQEIEDYCRKKNGALLSSSNFSLGVNIFFQLNQRLAQFMNGHPSYEVSIDETHHTQKKDAPSGTAITLAEGILKFLGRKKKWALNQKADDTITIQSHRIDPAPGTHVVTYSSPIDSIEIRHTAFSREGFALGAVMVAEWIRNKKGVLTMDEFLKF